MKFKKRIWDSPFYTRFKKHHCPNCGEILDIIQINEVVNSKSDEAKNFDFLIGDTYIIGDVEFIWDELKCKACGFQSSIKDMKQIEKNGEK